MNGCVRADVHGVAFSLPDNDLLCFAVDMPLVVPADGASEDNPVTFFMANAVVLDCLLGFRRLTSHGMSVSNSNGCH
jgi:hypothetical protein